ncbi:MAG: MATE family efflux transporter, partial [Lachnospiraceae bacterium]|nr:MATE family efflux transporter [Lachnospiraceae bacterium]
MKSAIHNTNMMNGSLWNKILLFALPLAATGILQQLFNAADIAVVGRFTGDQGEAAVAAVGANSPIIGLIVNAFIGISLGSNVVIANAVGCGNTKTVKKAVHTSVLLALIIGVFISVLGQIFAERIFLSQNVPDDVIDMAILYFRVYMTGVPVILLYNFEASIFRAIGNTKMPLIALTISGVLNVLLNLFFVCVLHMTVNGVALATVISNLISSIILLTALVKSDDMVQLKFSDLKIDGPVLKNILRIGIPAGIQSAVFSFANIIVQS